MGIKTKVTLAVGFVGAIAIAATAFGQVGSGDPSSPSASSAPHRAAAEPGHGGKQHCAAARPRATRRVVHGNLKVATRAGSFADLTVDSGQITAIDHSAKTITIKRADGESVTATAVDQTRVCLDGQSSSFDALKTGDLARLVQARSDRFTGLRRIAAVSPNNASGSGTSTSAGDDDLSSLLDEAA